ncbi:MAG TPA: VOC family protein [Kofleriaceae bacterium]|jgi:uncharacterized glyoxalase superfamily protein PhnB
MLYNRSAPHSRITPVLTVADVRAAVAWYGRVLGMVEHVRIGEGHRAQIGFVGSPAEIIVAEVRPGRRAPEALRSHQIMLKVEDVNAVVTRATADGATLREPVEDHVYGERQATLDDPFGHQWILTQTLVDTAPESFGCQTIVARS